MPARNPLGPYQRAADSSRGGQAWLRDAVRVIDGWLGYRRIRARIPALCVGIVSGDTVVFSRAYGHADEASRRKATPTTGYRIASISKVFTALAVMQLAERGAVRLDEHIAHYLPWMRATRDGSAGLITVRQLLSHTAGVERDGTPHWVTDRFPTLAQLKA